MEVASGSGTAAGGYSLSKGITIHIRTIGGDGGEQSPVNRTISATTTVLSIGGAVVSDWSDDSVTLRVRGGPRGAWTGKESG
jgi:hypothetical protein